MNNDTILVIKNKVESLTKDLTALLETIKGIEEDRNFVQAKKKEITDAQKDLAKREEALRVDIETREKQIEKEKEIGRERKEVLDAREKSINQQQEKLKRILQSV